LSVKNLFKQTGPGEARSVAGYSDAAIKVKMGYKESPSGGIILSPVAEKTRTIADIQLRLRDFQSVLEEKASIHDNYVFYRDNLSS
jgi:hypothetical protein